MKKYIGTKIVKAKHMTMTEARKVLGEVLTSASDEEEGYLVDYANGHESWIPKGVFEEICRRLGTLNFGEVIEFLKAGLAVRRKSWSGGKFIYYVPSASYPAMTDVAKSIMNEERKVSYKEYIAIRCKDGDVGFYTPTQCDVLAEDWEVVTE